MYIFAWTCDSGAALKLWGEILPSFEEYKVHQGHDFFARYFSSEQNE